MTEIRKKSKPAPKAPDERFEMFDWASLSPHPVIGIDEVGRGCLAGPVYAAAAIVPLEQVDFFVQAGVTDSKLLSPAKRESLATEIHRRCHVAIGFASHEEIDAINILQASFLAMRRALIDLESQLDRTPFGRGQAHLIVDGHQRIPMPRTEFVSPDRQWLMRATQTTLVKGDLRALPIAAASIVAKVARDRMMTEAAVEFPQYGFEKHKGYAAPVHRKAIAEHGPSRIHRKTFGGVREFLQRATVL